MAGAPAQIDILSDAGSELQRALIELLAPVDAELRAMTVARRLKIDKSLASKAVRCAKLPNPLVVVHEAPAAAGLGIVADAADRFGSPEAAVRRLREASSKLTRAIDAFPGGREGMDTALSAEIPELRRVSDKRARRSMFRAMSKLTGFEVDTFYVAYWYMASESAPDLCDNAWVSWTRGLRRYRSAGKILVGGINSSASADDPVRYAMDGDPIADDPLRMVLPEFSTASGDVLSMYRGNRMLGLILEEGSPPLGEPVNVAQGTWSERIAPRYAMPGKSWEYLRVTTRRPTRVLVADLVLGPGVYPEVTPVVSSRLSGIPFPPSTEGPEASPFDLAEQDYELWAVDPIKRGLHCPDAPGLDDLITKVHTQRGWNLADCRVWRLRIEYPFPMIETMIWLRLPERES
ncbi:MAG: hypothetical protein ACTS22_08170 [Phycisphaerales bacterium]